MLHHKSIKIIISFNQDLHTFTFLCTQRCTDGRKALRKNLIEINYSFYNTFSDKLKVWIVSSYSDIMKNRLPSESECYNQRRIIISIKSIKDNLLLCWTNNNNQVIRQLEASSGKIWCIKPSFFHNSLIFTNHGIMYKECQKNVPRFSDNSLYSLQFKFLFYRICDLDFFWRVLCF